MAFTDFGLENLRETLAIKSIERPEVRIVGPSRSPPRPTSYAYVEADVEWTAPLAIGALARSPQMRV